MIDEIARELESKVPLLTPYEPEGWKDFRAGYERGWRSGLCVAVAVDNGANAGLLAKACYDSRADVERAASALTAVREVNSIQILPRPSDMGLWVLQFVIIRDIQQNVAEAPK